MKKVKLANGKTVELFCQCDAHWPLYQTREYRTEVVPGELRINDSDFYMCQECGFYPFVRGTEEEVIRMLNFWDVAVCADCGHTGANLQEGMCPYCGDNDWIVAEHLDNGEFKATQWRKLLVLIHHLREGVQDV